MRKYPLKPCDFLGYLLRCKKVHSPKPCDFIEYTIIPAKKIPVRRGNRKDLLLEERSRGDGPQTNG